MLFSATMTAGVEELVKLSLHRPIQVAINTVGDVADHLVQEFIRIRPKYVPPSLRPSVRPSVRPFATIVNQRCSFVWAKGGIRTDQPRHKVCGSTKGAVSSRLSE